MASLSRFFRRLAAAASLPALLLGAALGPAAAQTPATDLPASQAVGIIKEITDAVGLQPRFELRATPLVDNAAAVVYNGRRYLLYNPTFLASVNRAGRTDWAGISILAHEMGHHLNGHTLRGGGSQPEDELEADEFSGFVLRRLGASLAQAQAALAAVCPEQGSATHPGRAPRLAAISQGWMRAQTQIAATAGPGATQPSAAPVVLAAVASPAPAPAPVATLARTGAAAPMSLVGQLTFRDNPEAPFYLTSQLTVVRLPEADDDTEAANRLAQAEVVGRLHRTGDAAFPFILEDSRRHKLFVNARGDVYNSSGQRVAELHD
ncbi:membrane-binding protein [Hymenobacter sp. RP-2-7]|uniref:Membrane-binding protein n=1 Tax=Hymenobacter polaris TaxID=2682546 RepID=A0A7Y0AB36_9BACT|nr:membrane-binding protein [Hymenobacter polaris]NML64023.1 membrane-binding protein [Hymenobacter polaris]